MKKAFLFAVVALCSGCRMFSGHEHEFKGPLVIGERINTVNAGETIKVPELVPPAKTWYLVDDVGLGIWLGIPMKNIQGTMTAYEDAITELDSGNEEVE